MCNVTKHLPRMFVANKVSICRVRNNSRWRNWCFCVSVNSAAAPGDDDEFAFVLVVAGGLLLPLVSPDISSSSSHGPTMEWENTDLLGREFPFADLYHRFSIDRLDWRDRRIYHDDDRSKRHELRRCRSVSKPNKTSFFAGISVSGREHEGRSFFFFECSSVTCRRSWQANSICSGNLITQLIISVCRRHDIRINKPYSILRFVEWERVRLGYPRSKHNLNKSARWNSSCSGQTLTANAIHAWGHRFLRAIHGETSIIVQCLWV